MNKMLLEKITNVKKGDIVFAVSKKIKCSLLALIIDKNKLCSYCNKDYQDETWNIHTNGVSNWYFYKINNTIIKYVKRKPLDNSNILRSESDYYLSNLSFFYIPSSNDVSVTLGTYKVNSNNLPDINDIFNNFCYENPDYFLTINKFLYCI